MERWMIVYLLPLEVWMDIFCYPWITREQFGQLVDKIGNFKFAEHAQFYLHEWGKHELGDLEFKQDGLHKWIRNKQTKEYYSAPVDFPQTPIPEKITFFQSIEIQHLDANTLDFFAKIRPLLLISHLCIVCRGKPAAEHEHLENLRTALTSLASMLDGRIHWLDCNDSTLPLLWQCFAPEQLAKTKVLEYYCDEDEADEEQRLANANTIVDWLTAAPADGPKICRVEADRFENYAQIIATIRQQFRHAKTAHTFAVNFSFFAFLENPLPEQQFHDTNGVGEELHGHFERCGFQITRHPADGNTKEWQKLIEKVTIGVASGFIFIWNPTIGPLNAAQEDKEEMPSPPPVDVEEEVEQQQPCSSKDT